MTNSLITHTTDSAVRRLAYFNRTQVGFGAQNSLNKPKLEPYEVIPS